MNFLCKFVILFCADCFLLNLGIFENFIYWLIFYICVCIYICVCTRSRILIRKKILHSKNKILFYFCHNSASVLEGSQRFSFTLYFVTFFSYLQTQQTRTTVVLFQVILRPYGRCHKPDLNFIMIILCVDLEN